jgi:uncharacterized protein
VTTRYPDDGRIRVEVTRTPHTPWTLSLRVPAWATDGATLTVGDERRPVGPGMAEVTRTFVDGDVVELELPVRSRWTWADPRIDAVRGQVAVERGPLVLCLESVDLGRHVDGARVLADADPLERDGEVLVRNVTGQDDSSNAGPSRGRPPASIADGESRLVPLTPYHRWASRGPCTMRVWLPVDGA